MELQSTDKNSWDSSRVLREIQDQFDVGASLFISGKCSIDRCRLKQYGARFFKKWDLALLAAGFNPRTGKPIEAFSKRRALAEISNHSYSDPIFRIALEKSASKYFGSIADTKLVAARFGSERKRRMVIAKYLLLNKLRFYKNYYGMDCEDVILSRAPKIRRQIADYIGSVEEALDEIGFYAFKELKQKEIDSTRTNLEHRLSPVGLEVSPVTSPFKAIPELLSLPSNIEARIAKRTARQIRYQPSRSKEQIIIAIKAVYEKNGLKSKNWISQTDECLYLDSKAEFGSWKRALIGAGLMRESLAGFLTKDIALKEIYESLKDLTHNDRSSVRAHDPYLYVRARKFFRNWKDAVLAAGLEYRPSESSSDFWTREMVIDEIRNYFAIAQLNGASIATKSHSMLYVRSKKFFREWKDAVQAAGLEFRPSRSRPDFSTREKVIDEIRRVFGNAPINGGSFGMKNHSVLYKRSKKFFPRWKLALEAAGLEYRKAVSMRVTKDIVVGEIATKLANEPFNYAGYVSSKYPKLYYRGKKFFPKWKAALAAAGLEHRAPAKWSQVRVKSELRILVKKKSKLFHVSEYKRTQPELYMNAVKHFGSWNKALDATRLKRFRNALRKSGKAHGKTRARNESFKNLGRM